MHTKTIRLVSGGSVTLTGEFNAFDLSGTDQCFLEEVLDKFIEYERDNAPRSEAA